MSLIEEMELPDISLLYRYQIEGAYTDCYVTDIPGDISQAEYVEAFYTTPLFKLERWILSWLAFRPSTDEEANALALAKRDKFAAWDVEDRNINQLLMCDFQGSTRSWLMSEPGESGESTRLYFGSAVVGKTDKHTGEKRLGTIYRLLMGFHKRYSRALLKAAVKRLSRSVD
jgi:hypothetical protein